MKKTFFFIVYLFIMSISAFADKICDDAMVEAKLCYSKGDYATAKNLFEFVKNVCGSNYNYVSNWIQNCNDMLTTSSLSLSCTSLIVDAEGGTKYIDITSNRSCVLKNTTSSIFTVTKNGTKIKILYYTNLSTNPRSGYFDVVTDDGTKSVRVTINQSAAIASNNASINDTKVNNDNKLNSNNIPVFLIKANGHEYVDLGLPSGTLWATCNVGANTPEEFGDYFAWGETSPKSFYDWSTYKYGTDYHQLTKYCYDSSYGKNGYTDTKTVLDLEDDAAHVNWGGDWRMPTSDELYELLKNCSWTWTSQNGVNGDKVTGPNGKSIFLPAAGCHAFTLFKDGHGIYWTSNVDHYNIPYRVCFNLSGFDWEVIPFRYYGLSVRAVIKHEHERNIDVNNSIYFDFNKWNISTLAKRNIQRVANKLKENPELDVEIRGYSDFPGSDDAHKKVSQNRVDAVKAELVSLGVDEKRITVNPTGSQASPQRADYQSRRCDFIYISNTNTSNINSLEEDKLTFTVNGVSFNMIYVEGGSFTMGATSEQGSDAYEIEKPTHKVKLSSFYMGETEVTQALWKAVMNTTVYQQGNKDYYKQRNMFGEGENYPMYYINYEECRSFINKLNTLLHSQLEGKSFAMPTEAQWEYAARGGNMSNGYKYSGSNYIYSVAWYDGNSGSSTHPVKAKQPNELGLYDMGGNVWEFCKDWFSRYSNSSQTNPQGPNSGATHVCRGGSFDDDAKHCCVSHRYSSSPSERGRNLGLRLVLIP